MQNNMEKCDLPLETIANISLRKYVVCSLYYCNMNKPNNDV